MTDTLIIQEIADFLDFNFISQSVLTFDHGRLEKRRNTFLGFEYFGTANQ